MWATADCRLHISNYKLGPGRRHTRRIWNMQYGICNQLFGMRNLPALTLRASRDVALIPLFHGRDVTLADCMKIAVQEICAHIVIWVDERFALGVYVPAPSVYAELALGWLHGARDIALIRHHCSHACRAGFGHQHNSRRIPNCETASCAPGLVVHARIGVYQIAVAD